MSHIDYAKPRLAALCYCYCRRRRRTSCLTVDSVLSFTAPPVYMLLIRAASRYLPLISDHVYKVVSANENLYGLFAAS